MNSCHLPPSALVILALGVLTVTVCMIIAGRSKPSPDAPATPRKLWLTAGERLRAGDRWVGADKPLGRFHEMAGLTCPSDNEYYREV